MLFRYHDISVRLLMFGLFFVLSCTLQATAHAKTGDMFTDSGWSAYQRPSVPSDRHRRGDMFSENAPSMSYYRGDMFRHKNLSAPQTALYRDGAYNDLSKQPVYYAEQPYKDVYVENGYVIERIARPCRNHGYHVHHRKKRIYR